MIATEIYKLVWIYITIPYLNTNALSIRKINDSFIADSDLARSCRRKYEAILFPVVVDSRGHRLTYQLPDVYKPNRRNNLKIFSTFHLPRYIRISLKYRRQRFVLILHKHSIVSSAGSFEWSADNTSYSEKIIEDCSYQGWVKGQVGSHVAVSICGGLSGVIVTATEELTVEPIRDVSNRTQRVGKGIPHRVHSCKTERTHLAFPDRESSVEMGISRRTKRQAAGRKRYLEVLIAADRSVVEYVGKDKARSYLLALMNIVNMVYQHESLGVDIEVAVVKILFLNEAAEDSVLWEADAQRTVDAFCQWLSIQSNRKSYYGGRATHDVAVLLTRTGIGPAGYAPITGMCNPRRSCAVVKDDGFTSAFIIAHEIAHVFGLQHDGHGNSCYGVSYQTGLMATTVQSSLRHYWWSGCSSTRMKDAVRNLHCLDNDPYKASVEEVTLPLGASWSLDEQCRQEFGEDFALCGTFSADPCNILWCSERSNPLLCKTKRGSPLEGTNCGHEQWCTGGRCEYHGDADPVDGGWGPWAAWSGCSSECGVGFRLRQRRCNDPSPAYGGQTCTGEDEQIDTCKTEDECTQYEDPWAEQCSSLNQLPVRQGLHSWSPYQRDDKSSLCKLTCVSEHNSEVVTMEIDVDDGTPCTYDEPDNICIRGQCVVVGCDGEKDSQRRADSCGVCGGDNSMCKTVQGKYSKMFEYSASGNQYERIVILPAGAKNIEVRESQTSSHFLAVKDPNYSYHILNGGGVQSHSKKFAVNGAWFKYTNNYGHEVLESKGPLRKELIVEIHPMDYMYKAAVTYRYTVQKDDHTYEKNRYHWQFEKWTECSVSCGTGTHAILYGCYDKDTSVEVEDNKCQYIDDPHGDSVACKRAPCDAEKIYWVMSAEFTECSASCGGSGVQQRLFSCETERAEDGHTEAVLMEMCQHLAEPVELQPCNTQIPCILDWTTSDWSECSVTCGSGIRRRSVVCGDGPSDDHMCAGERPSSSDICEISVCLLNWSVGEWSECSVTCGDGLQRRDVYCGDIQSDVDKHMCDDDPPSSVRNCQKPGCPMTWTPEDWGDCSVTCGRGIQRREVYCGDITSAVSEHKCDTEPPSSVRSCQQPGCPLEWTTGDWLECSVTCGIGTQRRTVDCGDADSDFDDHMCDSDPPPSLRSCQLAECYVDWTVSEWEKCSVTCGMGIKRRSVYCESPDDDADDDMCITKPPPSTRLCELAECQLEWTVSPWSECSETCGGGLKERVVFCGDPEDESDDYLCHENRPEVTQLCNHMPCYDWQTDEWSECSVTCGGGVRKRKVYCSNGEEEVLNSLCLGESPPASMICGTETCEEPKNNCLKDRLTFCAKSATAKKCRYKGYQKACCKSCEKFVDSLDTDP